jgi:hypothetical protein
MQLDGTMCTKAMAENLAAWDRDKLKSAYYGYGLGDVPQTTFVDQYNYPDRGNEVNDKRAAHYASRGGK